MMLYVEGTAWIKERCAWMNLRVFFKFLFIYFNWRMITFQYCAGFCHKAVWIGHRYTSVPSIQHTSPHPLLLGCHGAPALGALLHASNSTWLSMLHVVMYMFQCYSLNSSHPVCPLWGGPVNLCVIKTHRSGTSLAAQWLRLHASSAGSISSIPGRGTKIPHAVQPKKKTQNKTKKHVDPNHTHTHTHTHTFTGLPSVLGPFPKQRFRVLGTPETQQLPVLVAAALQACCTNYCESDL